MKAVYQDFLTANQNCSKFARNKGAIAVFDFLNQDQRIIRMIDCCEMGKPALAACVSELEDFVDGMPGADIDLTDGFTRTAVGRMIKAILAPFGYRPTVQRSFPKTCRARYFSSASCYRLTAPASMKVAKFVTEA